MTITKKEIREMSLKSAVEWLMAGTKAHLTGAGCGPGHRIPEGQEKKLFQIAYEKAYKHVYGRYSDNVKE